MKKYMMSDPAYRRDLGGGLVLRWSTPADVEALVELYGYVFRDNAEQPPSPFIAAWTRDMMSGRHPLIGPGDFALVEDTDKGMIVAATCLLSQIWEYEDIAFPIGRPEIVGSMPDYRNRGLVRAVFELIHARSAALGHLAQGITGIPYYYRQFGYEYALDLEGSRSVYFAAIPKLKAGEQELYGLRRATLDDLPRLMDLYDRERARGPASSRPDEAFWRWSLEGQSSESAEGWDTYMIVDGAGQPVGYVLPKRRRWGDAIRVLGVSVDGAPLIAVLPALLRALQSHAASMPLSRPDAPPPTKISFVLNRAHPVYDALGEALAANYDLLYAWYVRVPDLPGFIRHIAPALEQRLADSFIAGYSGELKLDFYRGGLRLVFEDGRLTAAEDWRRPVWGPEPQGGFPPLVFLQLLFGRRSLAELRYAFPDVWAENSAQPLLDVLFPAQPSWVLPLE